jgi:hypothetical protein
MKKALFLLFVCVTLFSCQNNKNKFDNKDLTVKTMHHKDGTQAQKTIETGCSYDNDVATLGIGLIIAPPKLVIYNDSLLAYRSGSYDIYNEDESKINICPKFFEPDYGIMNFVCISSTKKAYRVLVSYSEAKYLPKSKVYLFKSWPDYINESYGVRRKTGEDKNGSTAHLQPLRKAPLDNADTLAIPAGYEMFCPVEIKGDWVRVKFDCFYNDDNNKHEGEPCADYIDKCTDPVSGWLKWHNGNKLLIEILTQP